MANITHIKAQDPRKKANSATSSGPEPPQKPTPPQKSPQKAASKAPTAPKSAEVKQVATTAAKDKKAQKAAAKAAKRAKKASQKAQNAQKPKKPMSAPVRFITWPFRYVHESWLELRQVRWPSRGATWKMVFAVLVYTALFIIIIMLLDALFTLIFNQLLS